MCGQENMRAMPRHLFLSLKGIRIHYFLPLVVMYVLLPLFGYLQYRQDGTAAMRETVVNNSQFLLPFLSVWWLMFIFRTYVEADGNELFYVYNGKSKLPEALCLLGVYLAHAALPYLVYSFFLQHMWTEFLRLSIQCLFFTGIAYFLLYATRSVALTLMPLVIYTFSSYIAWVSKRVFYPLYLYKGTLELRTSLPLLITGILLLAAGWLCNRRMQAYNG